jgi:5-methylcytosine-specific restriction endonuclease McrA
MAARPPPADAFYLSSKWTQVRYDILLYYGPICMKCKSTKKIHVDHIKPRSKYPELETDFENLQVLCEPCNLEKGNKNETDWRPHR